MGTFSLKLTDETERQIAEIIARRNYEFKCQVFLDAIDLLYKKTCIKTDEAVTEELHIQTVSDTSALPPSGELKVIITRKDCEPEYEKYESSYDRLTRVLGSCIANHGMRI